MKNIESREVAVRSCFSSRQIQVQASALGCPSLALLLAGHLDRALGIIRAFDGQPIRRNIAAVALVAFDPLDDRLGAHRLTLAYLFENHLDQVAVLHGTLVRPPAVGLPLHEPLRDAFYGVHRVGPDQHALRGWYSL